MNPILHQEIARVRHAELIREASRQYGHIPDEQADSKPLRPRRLRAVFTRRSLGRPAFGTR
jgi:hypothetical protein